MPAVVVVAAIGAVSGAASSVMASKDAKKARQASMSAEERRRDDAETFKQDDLARIEKDRDMLKEDKAYFDDLAKKNYEAGNTEAAQFYAEQSTKIDAEAAKIDAAIEGGYEDVVAYTEERRARDMPGIEKGLAERQGLRSLAQGEASLEGDRASKTAGLAGAERDKLIGAGDRPGELDAVHSEIEDSFASARINAEREAAAKGKTLSPTQSLALAIEKAKAKGEASAGLRRDWTATKANLVTQYGNQVLNAGNAATSAKSNAALLYDDTSERIRDAESVYDDVVTGAKDKRASEKIALQEKQGGLQLGALSGYQQSQTLYRQNYQDEQKINRSTYSGGLLNLSAQESAAGKVALGINDNASSKAGDAYNAQAIASQRASDEAAKSAGESAGRAFSAYGNKKATVTGK